MLTQTHMSKSNPAQIKKILANQTLPHLKIIKIGKSNPITKTLI
jgi:hypothetical protein